MARRRLLRYWLSLGLTGNARPRLSSTRCGSQAGLCLPGLVFDPADRFLHQQQHLGKAVKVGAITDVVTTHAGEMLHQAHAGELEIGFPGFPVRQASLQGRQLIHPFPVDAIPGGLFDPAAALLQIADGTQAEMGFRSGQAMQAVGLDPFAEGSELDRASAVPAAQGL